MKKVFFSTLFACACICAAFLVGCQHEATPQTTQDVFSGKLPTPVIQGKFTKSFEVPNADKKSSVIVEVRADVDVLEQIKAEDLGFVINPKAAYDENFNDSGNGAAKPTQFISVRIKSAKSDVYIEGYTLTFSENFQSMVRSHNLGMMIDLSIPTVTSTTGKAMGSWSTCSKKVRVTRTGTGTTYFDLYWATSCSATYSYACSGSCTNYTDRSVCYCGNSAKYWRSVVTSGAAASVTGYSAC